ncbi:MAG TPA: hypothetical protein VH280_06905 [Verrucomicrobiae bacterium]|jgi:hypothetical protein|nr:hypothetical protein [Verrucomicrobiae bacterium]
MKHKANIGPGLIVALGAPSQQSPDREGAGPLAHARGSVNTLSDVANTDTVPLTMLAMPDDQEQMQPPEVGDVVNYQVTGKVVAIEGDCARVQRQSINGQELQNSQNPSDDDDENDNDSQGANADDSGDLRNQAAGIGMLS